MLGQTTSKVWVRTPREESKVVVVGVKIYRGIKQFFCTHFYCPPGFCWLAIALFSVANDSFVCLSRCACEILITSELLSLRKRLAEILF